MIGTRLYKSKLNLEEYTKTARWCNENNAYIADKGKYYQVMRSPKPTKEEVNAAEVARLKDKLASTDYKCLKYLDGALTKAEYLEVRAYREDLRNRIRELTKE